MNPQRFMRNRHLVILIKLVFVISSVFFLNRCGCDGGGGSDSNISTEAVGVFKASNVSGLSYISGGQKGVTKRNGGLTYEVDSPITFSIGAVTIGTTQGKPVVTPADLASASGADMIEVNNIVRFLCMLDDDGNPDNGIHISPEVRAVADMWSQVDFSTTDLSSECENIRTDCISADNGEHNLPDYNTVEEHLNKTRSCIDDGFCVDSYLDMALHILPPLGEDSEDKAFDRTLTDFLSVIVCEVNDTEGCAVVEEFTSQNHHNRLDFITLQDHYYQVKWKVARRSAGKEFEIHFIVAGLEVRYVTYTPSPGMTVSIKFRIDNNPQIRARVLAEKGFLATEIAEILRDEFALIPKEALRVLALEGYDVAEIVKALIYAFDETTAQECAQILRTAGYSVVEIGQALKESFQLDASGVAGILKDVGYSALEVAECLKQAFSQDALGTVGLLKQVGFSALDSYIVFEPVFQIEDRCMTEQILEDAGYSQEEFLGVVEFDVVQKFAPVLKFDRAHNGLPMSAQRYYENMLCGDTEGCPGQTCERGSLIRPPECCQYLTFPNYFVVPGETSCVPEEYLYTKALYYIPPLWELYNIPMPRWIQNNSMQNLTNGSVPTYYKVTRCGTCQLRITYWWFYAYQPTCYGNEGSHAADWEHITVTISEDRSQVHLVTYFQHSGWYTRLGGDYPRFHVDGIRPVVYVGKRAHGSYVDSCCASGCDRHCAPNFLTPRECTYFGDFRNPWPGERDVWNTGSHNDALVDLDGNSESWIVANRVSKWAWGYSKVWTQPPWPGKEEYNCGGLAGCKGTAESYWSTAGRGCRDTYVRGPIPTTDSFDDCVYVSNGPQWQCGDQALPPPEPSWGDVTEIAEMAAAATLGLSLEAYRTAVAEGKTLCEIADAKGVNLVAAWVAAEGSREAIILQALADGLITESGADWLRQLLADPPEFCPNVAEVRDRAIAVTLGMSLEEYVAAVADGLLLCQLAALQDSGFAEAWVAAEGSREAIILQALSDGLINQTEADWLRQKLADPPAPCDI